MLRRGGRPWGNAAGRRLSRRIRKGKAGLPWNRALCALRGMLPPSLLTGHGSSTLAERSIPKSHTPKATDRNSRTAVATLMPPGSQTVLAPLPMRFHMRGASSDALPHARHRWVAGDPCPPTCTPIACCLSPRLGSARQARASSFRGAGDRPVPFCPVLANRRTNTIPRGRQLP